MIVWGTSLSPFARKVLGFLSEKKIPVEHRPVTPQVDIAEFRACSPVGKIPAIDDDGYRLADSSAICHYLERKYPEPALFPKDAKSFGRMMWWEEYSDTILVPAAGQIFFQLVVRPRLLREQPDMAVVDKALTTDCPRVFAHLEKAIDGPFIVGDQITLADIALHCIFVNLKLAGHPLDAERWPNLGGYIAGLMARPTLGTIRDPKAA